MATAMFADLSGLPGVQVFSTWDCRLPAPRISGLTLRAVAGPDEEWAAFRELARHCQAAMVIAPEFDCILQDRIEEIERAGTRNLGAGSRATALCADKLALAEHWRQHGVSTIPTALVDWSTLGRGTVETWWPRVVKPRFGAGSQANWLVQDLNHLARLAGDGEPLLKYAVCQPLIAGRALSAAVLIDPRAGRFEVLPAADQCLSTDGRFRYLGGRIPAAGLAEPARRAVASLARRACQVVPGLRGYAGVDIILPDDAPDQPLAVEINPRLTTSYVGYRQLAGPQIAQHLVWPDRLAQPIEWAARAVEFAADPSATNMP